MLSREDRFAAPHHPEAAAQFAAPRTSFRLCANRVSPIKSAYGAPACSAPAA